MQLGLIVIPFIFAKEVFGKDINKPNNVLGASNIADGDDSEPDLSLTSSDVSSCSSSIDGLSIDESYVDEASQIQLCNLLGPSVPGDETISTANNSNLPPSLEDSITIDLPVGFLRTRRAFLSNKSKFWTDSILKKALNYDEVKSSGWVHAHQHFIGDPHLPPHLDVSDLIGASKETTYRMPASRLVSASMAFETSTLIAYTDDFFAISISTSTPEVPFGRKFLARTQIVVINTGNNSCRMICSVEPEFPNGPPLGMKWQIQKGMKKGTLEMFAKIGSHIKNCAVSYGWC